MANRPARSVLFLQPKPGMQADLLEVFRRIDVPGNAMKQHGCLSVEIHAHPEPDGPVLVTALWANREDYDGWLNNPWREYSGEQLSPFMSEERAPGIVYDVYLAEGTTTAAEAGAPTMDRS